MGAETASVGVAEVSSTAANARAGKHGPSAGVAGREAGQVAPATQSSWFFGGEFERGARENV